ncbi:hypothetical protein KKH3_38330 [Pectobacterium actinidiae]|nr:hypothetical protein KKH3_38330 [Pectobacterium actinidiae]
MQQGEPRSPCFFMSCQSHTFAANALTIMVQFSRQRPHTVHHITGYSQLISWLTDK